jgi:hypothetical protein
MRKPIAVLICFFLCIPIYAQQSYTINGYGTYIIDNNTGIIKKIPADQDLFFYKFWKNYALFSLMGRDGMIVFNIESGAVSEIFFEPYLFGPKILGDENYFVIFAYGYIYKFDPKNLDIIEKIYVGELYKYPDTDATEIEGVQYERTGNYTLRCWGKNNYVEIIDASQIERPSISVVHKSTLNWYVVCIHKIDYGR